MPRLGAPLADFRGRREHAIHRTRGTEVPLLLEQRGMDFGGRLIDEPIAVQHVEHRLAFGGTQRARRRRPGPRGGGGRRGTPTAIERGPGHADALPQRRRLAGRRDGLDGPHQSVSSSSRGVRGIPRISATFLAISEFPKGRKYLISLSFRGKASVRPAQVGGFDVNIVIHGSTAVRGRGDRIQMGPVEADGAVDAQNAPTAPWKTLRVFHELHRAFPIKSFTKNPERPQNSVGKPG